MQICLETVCVQYLTALTYNVIKMQVTYLCIISLQKMHIGQLAFFCNVINIHFMAESFINEWIYIPQIFNKHIIKKVLCSLKHLTIYNARVQRLLWDGPNKLGQSHKLDNYTCWHKFGAHNTTSQILQSGVLLLIFAPLLTFIPRYPI